jgi:addiction module RelE/StbE family toxin
MIKVSFASSFSRAFKKKLKGRRIIERLFWEKLDTFIKDPFEQSLKTHRLSGKLKDLWSFTVEYNLRVVFYFKKNNTQAVFIDIGTHDEVY